MALPFLKNFKFAKEIILGSVIGGSFIYYVNQGLNDRLDINNSLHKPLTAEPIKPYEDKEILEGKLAQSDYVDQYKFVKERRVKKTTPKQPFDVEEKADEAVDELWQDTSELTFIDSLNTGDLAFIRYNLNNVNIFKKYQLKFIRFITGRYYDDISLVYRKQSTSLNEKDNIVFILSPCISTSHWAKEIHSKEEDTLKSEDKDVKAHFMDRLTTHPGFLKSELKSLLLLDRENSSLLRKFRFKLKKDRLCSFEYLHLLVYQDPDVVTIRRLVCTKKDRELVEESVKNLIKENKHKRSILSDVFNAWIKEGRRGLYPNHYIESLKERVEIIYGNMLIDNSKLAFFKKLEKTPLISEANGIVDSLIDLERAGDKCHSLLFKHSKIIALFEKYKKETEHKTIKHSDTTLVNRVYQDSGIIRSDINLTQENLLDFVPLNGSAIIPPKYIDESIKNPLSLVIPRLSSSFDLHDGYMQQARRVAQAYPPLHTIIKVPT